MAPVLAGHDGDAGALARSRWQDWLASAEAAFVRLRATSPASPVAVLGFSTGGLLALHLAATHGPAIAAVAMVSTPLRLRRAQATAIRWLGKLPAFLSAGPLGYVPKFGGSDVADADARRENPGLSVMPLSALASLIDLMETVRPLLPAVTAPALVAHGMRDRTVPFEDSLEIAGCIGSEVIERVWLERTGHLALVDVEKHHLVVKIVSFLEAHATNLPRTQESGS
jgi:carboxylesterase